MTAEPSSCHQSDNEESATEPVLSVVIPAHNAADTIAQQLDALVGQGCRSSWEIVVVDNQSSDATALVAERYRSGATPVTIVRATEGRTPGYARNVGVAHSRGERIAFCDADDVVSDDWVERIDRALAAHPVVAGVLDYRALNPAWVRGVRGGDGVHRLSDFEGVFPFAISACLGVSREVFDRLGGFDEHMFPGEDLELSFRLWLEHIPIAFDETVVVNYRLRDSLRGTWAQAREYGRGSIYIRRRAREEGVIAGRRIKWRNLLWLLRHVPLLLARSGRFRWTWVAGSLYGEVTGAMKVRAAR